jgi:hypothetical protein
MMSKLKSVKTAKPINAKTKDKRTHKEKLEALREALGVAKERARTTGSVNECTVVKICSTAGVHRDYLFGRRLKDEDENKDKYLKIKIEVDQFKKNFSSSIDISEDRKALNDLQERYDELLVGIIPREKRLVHLEDLGIHAGSSYEEQQQTETMLQAKINQQESQINELRKGSNGSGSLERAIKRHVVCIDDYRMIDGKYRYGDSDVDQVAVGNALIELHKLLERDIKMRLYLLVGLPCSGKSYWAKKAYLKSDRHPVIFDATNLSTNYRKLFTSGLNSKFNDLAMTCVYFDTDMQVISERNYQRAEKQMTDKELDSRFAELEKPDIYTEHWMQDLIVVRS